MFTSWSGTVSFCWAVRCHLECVICIAHGGVQKREKDKFPFSLHSGLHFVVCSNEALSFVREVLSSGEVQCWWGFAVDKGLKRTNNWCPYFCVLFGTDTC